MVKISKLNFAYLALLVGAPAFADGVTVVSSVTATGFYGNVSTAFRSDTLTNPVYSCYTDGMNSCATSHTYNSKEKNLSVGLCLPSPGTYILTQSCQDLLNKTGNGECDVNKDSVCSVDAKTITPVSYWTTERGGTATWTWTVDYVNGAYNIDCSVVGFQGCSE